MSDRSRPARILGVAALLIPVASVLFAVGAALVSEHRTVARLDLTGAATEVTIDCGFRGGSTREAWGEAASRLCEPIEGSALLRAGMLAVVGGLAGEVLVALARRRRADVRVSRVVAPVVFSAGVTVAIFSALSDPSAGTVAPLVAGAEEVIDAVGPEQVVEAFETLELRTTRFGLRVNSERWYVVRAEVAEVRAAIDELGWSMADVAPAFDDGWVAARATAAPDVVEIGRFDAVLDQRSDAGSNARRLLQEEVDGTGADAALTVVHFEPAANISSRGQ